MNPFDLPGPQFLLFFAVFSALVLLGLHLMRRAQESGPPSIVSLDDPYLVAYLSGGRDQAVAVAATSLIDRGLLKMTTPDKIEIGREDAEQLVHRPIEKELLSHFKAGAAASSLFPPSSLSVEGPCREYAESLERLDALPDAGRKSTRLKMFLLAAGILAGVTFIKIGVAFSRGRHNVLFLVVLAALACWGAYRIVHPFRTARGDALLADLKTLYGSLKERAESIPAGGASSELAWLGAVFGMAAVPFILFPFAGAFQPHKTRRSAGDSSGYSCSSSSCSSGSSCSSSSCGSSCGGGGGGCGGCGS